MPDNKVLRTELKKWLDEGLIDPTLYETLDRRYPAPGKWNLRVVIRWALIVGAGSLGVGLISLITVILDSLAFLAFLFSAGAVAFFGFGLVLLRAAKRSLPKTGNALIVVACLLLAADVFTLAKLLLPAGDHWSLLVLFVGLAYLALAYAFRNPTVLVMALIAVASWFGAESGYASGWGAYYLGMNYPLRFAVASPLVLLVGYLHQRFLPGRFEGFVKVYFALGLLYLSLSLWILSIFGTSELPLIANGDSHGVLAAFSLLWLGVSVGCFVLGSRFDNRMFRGFGLTFVILNLYTRYYEYFWNSLDKWVFFIVLGLVTLGVGMGLERWQKARARS